MNKIVNYLRAEAVSGSKDEFGVEYRSTAEVSSLTRDAHQPREFPRNGILAPNDSCLSCGDATLTARYIRHYNKCNKVKNH